MCPQCVFEKIYSFGSLCKFKKSEKSKFFYHILSRRKIFFTAYSVTNISRAWVPLSEATLGQLC